MLFSDPSGFFPEDILDWLSVCIDGLYKERSSVLDAVKKAKTEGAAVPPTFLGMTPDEVQDYFRSAERELEIAAVLALIASAEARIRLDSRTRLKGADSLARSLRKLFDESTSEWSVALYQYGICDAWKDYISQTGFSNSDKDRYRGRIGAFKELLSVRHWVAHGRYWAEPPMLAQYPPVLVVRAVNELFAALADISIRTGIKNFV
ncbi:hypothetical protein ABIC71_001165 [Herbaspirillum seropedicae]|uniref:hypothetical protein n=1 Tax=Herbaspirillum seropedicae TaxID=964 RepID=UPI0033967C0D